MRNLRRAANLQTLHTATRPDSNASIHIEIDELIIHGIPPADRYLFADALSAELTRLLEDPQQSIPFIQNLAGQPAAQELQRVLINTNAVLTPGSLGNQVARAILDAAPFSHDRPQQHPAQASK